MSIKNIRQCYSLLEYDGEMFVGIFTDKKQIYYSLNSDKDNSTRWAVLDCSDCQQVLAAYLLGKATLLQVYQKAKRHIEQESPTGELEFLSQTLDEPPFETSVLFYPATDAFKTTFPGIEENTVASFCERATILKAAVAKHFPLTSTMPEEKPDDTAVFSNYADTKQCNTIVFALHRIRKSNMDALHSKEKDMAIFKDTPAHKVYRINLTYKHQKNAELTTDIPVLPLYQTLKHNVEALNLKEIDMTVFEDTPVHQVYRMNLTHKYQKKVEPTTDFNMPLYHTTLRDCHA